MDVKIVGSESKKLSEKRIGSICTVYIFQAANRMCSQTICPIKKKKKNMDSVLSNVQITEDNIKPKPKSGRTSPYTH